MVFLGVNGLKFKITGLNVPVTSFIWHNRSSETLSVSHCPLYQTSRARGSVFTGPQSRPIKHSLHPRPLRHRMLLVNLPNEPMQQALLRYRRSDGSFQKRRTYQHGIALGSMPHISNPVIRIPIFATHSRCIYNSSCKIEKRHDRHPLHRHTSPLLIPNLQE